MAEIENGDGEARSTAAARRRAALLQAADQVVKRYGAETSAALIAREAGVTKPIIYRHFADIDDLYRELGEKYRADLAEFMYAARPAESDRAARYRMVVDAFFQAVADYPNVYRFVMQKALSKDSPLSRFTHEWASALAAYFAQESGRSESSTGSSIVGFAVVGAMQTAASHWLEAGGSRSEAVNALVDLLLNGLPEPASPVTVADYPCQAGVSEANRREKIAVNTVELETLSSEGLPAAGGDPAPAELPS